MYFISAILFFLSLFQQASSAFNVRSLAQSFSSGIILTLLTQFLNVQISDPHKTVWLAQPSNELVLPQSGARLDLTSGGGGKSGYGYAI